MATPFGLALGELLSGLDPGSPCRIRLGNDGAGRIALEIEGRPGGVGTKRFELALTLIQDQLHGTLEAGSVAEGRLLVRATVPNRKPASPH